MTEKGKKKIQKQRSNMKRILLSLTFRRFIIIPSFVETTELILCVTDVVSTMAWPIHSERKKMVYIGLSARCINQASENFSSLCFSLLSLKGNDGHSAI